MNSIWHFYIALGLQLAGFVAMSGFYIGKFKSTLEKHEDFFERHEKILDRHGQAIDRIIMRLNSMNAQINYMQGWMM